MADQIQFDEFELSYEAYLTGRFPAVRPGLEPQDYYDFMIRELRQDPYIWAHTGFGFVIERGWYEQNRPEFKVHPGIIAALETTHVEIDAKYFKMPFGTFMVRFPRHTLRESPESPYVRSMLVTTVLEPLPRQQIALDGLPLYVTSPGDPVVDKLVIYVCFEPIKPKPASSSVQFDFNYFKFPLLHGQTIQHTFEATKMRSDGGEVQPIPEFDERGYWPSRTLYMRLLQIAVGVAFFAIGRDRQKKHSLVEEERLSRQERKRIAKETGERTRDVRRPTFVIGREIELPRFEPENREKSEADPSSECASCGDPFADHTKERRGCSVPDCQCLQWDSGRHISYGYIRSGHLHWYCTGKRKPGPGETNDYELRWLNPHPVRPDLPMGSPKSRMIKAPTNEIISADMTKLQNP